MTQLLTYANRQTDWPANRLNRLINRLTDPSDWASHRPIDRPTYHQSVAWPADQVTDRLADRPNTLRPTDRLITNWPTDRLTATMSTLTRPDHLKAKAVTTPLCNTDIKQSLRPNVLVHLSTGCCRIWCKAGCAVRTVWDLIRRSLVELRVPCHIQFPHPIIPVDVEYDRPRFGGGGERERERHLFQ